MKGCTTPPGSTPPNLYDQQCGFFYNEGSTFSSVFLRPLVLARPGFEPTTSHSADQRLPNLAKRATASLVPHSPDRFTYFIRILAENIQTFVVNESRVG